MKAIVYAFLLTGIVLMLIAGILVSVLPRIEETDSFQNDLAKADYMMGVGLLYVIGAGLIGIGLLNGIVLGEDFSDNVRAGMAIALGFVVVYLFSVNSILSLLSLW